jgi:hypothetical protein
MKTANIGNIHNLYNQYQSAVNPGKEDNKSASNLFTNPVDTYTPTVKGAADPAAIDRLWKETNHATGAIRKLVASMLGKNDASGQSFWAVRAGGSFKLSEADRAEAQQMVGEDGFFGAKQTTDRIMSFAKALVGEGASEDKIEKMRSAVQKGFNDVARMFGGFDKLPDVTKDTYKSIMKSFDDWKAGGASVAE